MEFESAPLHLASRRRIKPLPVKYFRRNTSEYVIQSRISRNEGGKGLMALATHPLPVFHCRLTMYLRQGGLNGLTSADFCPVFSVPASDHRSDDCGHEGDNSRDDGTHCVTHRTILTPALRDHNAPRRTL
ncbi:hypothetical protein [Streptomyces shenzhenensis]|uniref:hypothetical protein n=1 Tax=Streptomyces shenzhenensis TaxID=943815 RepID=UPI001F3E989D|nr:hypothetical protein [Streptomyces shenzhenensis]